MLLLIPVLIAGICGCSRQEQPDLNFKEFFYVGTFDTRGSQGLYVFEFERDELQLTQIQTINDRPAPNFQALHSNGHFLYSVSSDPFSDENNHGTISAYRIDRKTGMLTLINEQPTGNRGPLHISVDPQGRFAFVSHYGPGTLSVFGINEDGSLTEMTDQVQHEGASIHPDRQRGPHVHSAVPSPDGRFVYASDLGIDKIMIYELDRATGTVAPAPAPYVENTPGAGPRHFTIHPNEKFAYSIEELSFTIAAFSVDPSTGALKQNQRLNAVPDTTDISGYMSAADIHISPDQKFLYGSVRGADILSIYEIDQSTGRLRVVGYEPTGGIHPRNFGIDQNGEFVFVANRDDDNVVFFRRDKTTGELSFTGLEVNVPAAVCVNQLILHEKP